MPDFSLIPKQQKERALPRFTSFRGPKLEFNLLSKIGIVLLAVVVAASAVLFFWKGSLGNKKAALQEEFKNTVLERDTALEKELKNASVLLGSIGEIFDNHRQWSELFKIIEARTIQKVSFRSFEGTYQTGTFLLAGTSPNFSVLAQQIKSLEQEAKITNIDVSNVGVNKRGLVAFVLDITFNKSLLRKTLTP